MADPSGVIFYGDPHGQWQPLLEEYAHRSARAVILLGDCELERPLRQVLEPIHADGCPVLWIHGNHDSDRTDWWENLTGAEGGLHGTVANLGGLRVAGLGGTYAGRAWYPKLGDEEPRFRTRRDWLQAIPRHERCGKELPLRKRAFSLPEDHERLSLARADVLVTHEAPTSHQHGFGALDDLARDVGARLVVHGHHHRGYTGWTRDGIPVRGLGLAECWRMEE